MNVALACEIYGWMSEGELRFLAEQASKSKTIIEVGVYCGRSTRAMADNTNGIIYAIDPWSPEGYGEYKGSTDYAFEEYKKGEGNNIYNVFLNNLGDCIKSGKVSPQKMKFNDFWIEDPNMIFIDACHDYKHVLNDIHHALVLMFTKGGLICGHDYNGNFPGVMQAVDEVFGNEVQFTESIWWINL